MRYKANRNQANDEMIRRRELGIKSPAAYVQ